jgi:O-antigen/teichoic acid export membrane protein
MTAFFKRSMSLEHKDALEIGGTLLLRNTCLNLLGQVLPGLVGLLATPFIIRGLGMEAFGVFSLAVVVLGYIGLFDLGLAAATTKYVAESLATGDLRRLTSFVWTSMAVQLSMGIVAGIALAFAVPALTAKVFRIPAPMAHDFRITFFLLAASLPIVLGGSCLRGVLEAGQKFDLVNLVKVPTAVSTFLLPAVGVYFHLGIVGIMVLLILSRLGAFLWYWILCVRSFPSLAERSFCDRSALRSLFTYGFWTTISNVVGPLFHYLDRVFIGALLSVTALSYYTGPQQFLNGIWIIPFSLTITLFPAFSSLEAASRRETIAKVYALSLKTILLTVGPLVLLAVFLARTILRLWLGVEFAEQSTFVFQILLIGALVNSLALCPHALIRALGRPDLTAKFHLLELPIYVAMLWFLVKKLGIAGAAWSWSFWVCLNAVLLFAACAALDFVPARSLLSKGITRSVAFLIGLAVALSLCGWVQAGLAIRIVLGACFVGLFGWAAWCYALEAADRNLLKAEALALTNAVREF